MIGLEGVVVWRFGNELRLCLGGSWLFEGYDIYMCLGGYFEYLGESAFGFGDTCSIMSLDIPLPSSTPQPSHELLSAFNPHP